MSAGIRHHPSFLIPTPSYFHLHHTYLCVGFFSPSVSHLRLVLRKQPNKKINNILSLLALYKLFIWASLCKTVRYCFSNKHHCSWKTNAHTAAPQRKTCKYRILDRQLSWKLNLYLCFLSQFGPAMQKGSQKASQRLGLASEPRSFKCKFPNSPHWAEYSHD